MSKFLVLGGGISGLDAARLLAHQGHNVTLSDKATLKESVKAELLAQNILVHEGSQDYGLLKNCDGVILSPGVPFDLTLLEMARIMGIPLYSEIEYALNSVHAKSVVGVTGTNGKSTICMMIDHMLRSSGHESICLGNIGVSLSSAAITNESPDSLVLELSSYQLEHSHSMALDVAVFSTFSFDHIARHKTLYNYFAAKWKILSMLRPYGTFVTTAPIILQARQFNFIIPPTCHVVVIDYPEIFGTSSLPLRLHGPIDSSIFTIQADDTVIDQNKSLVGHLSPSQQTVSHNKLNALLSAFSVVPLARMPLDPLLASLSHFQHLPFRCQKVSSIHKHPIINDSKSTNVESAMVALQSQLEPVILLLGGKPKGESYTPLIQLKHRIKRIFAFGEAAPTICAQLQDALTVTRYDTLRACLDDLFSQYSRDPAPILFSPACASFDEFDNFEHRGHFFNTMIQKYFGTQK